MRRNEIGRNEVLTLNLMSCNSRTRPISASQRRPLLPGTQVLATAVARFKIAAISKVVKRLLASRSEDKATTDPTTLCSTGYSTFTLVTKLQIPNSSYCYSAHSGNTTLHHTNLNRFMPTDSLLSLFLRQTTLGKLLPEHLGHIGMNDLDRARRVDLDRKWRQIRNKWGFVGLTVTTLPSARYLSTTGMLVSTKVRKRFLMLSTLSSSRPLVFPRSRRRSSMTSSVVSKNKTNADMQTYQFKPSFSTRPAKRIKIDLRSRQT